MSVTSAQLKADLETRGYTVTLSNASGDAYTCALTEGPTADCSVDGYGRTQEIGERNALRDARRASGIPDTDLLYQEFFAILDRLPTHDYGDVSGPVTIDMGNGYGLAQTLTLTGDLVADDITLTAPAGSRKMTLEIIQDGTGDWEIDPAAWPSNVNFGSKGVPAFGESAGARRFLVFDFRVGGSEVCVHYDTNVF